MKQLWRKNLYLFFRQSQVLIWKMMKFFEGKLDKKKNVKYQILFLLCKSINGIHIFPVRFWTILFQLIWFCFLYQKQEPSKHEKVKVQRWMKITGKVKGHYTNGAMRIHVSSHFQAKRLGSSLFRGSTASSKEYFNTPHHSFTPTRQAWS